MLIIYALPYFTCNSFSALYDQIWLSINLRNPSLDTWIPNYLFQILSSCISWFGSIIEGTGSYQMVAWTFEASAFMMYIWCLMYVDVSEWITLEFYETIQNKEIFYGEKYVKTCCCWWWWWCLVLVGCWLYFALHHCLLSSHF